MYATLIYLISTTSAVGLYLLWKLSQLISPTTRWKILFFLRKRLLYSLVLRRRKGTSEITVSSFLGVAVIVAANVTASTIKLRDRTEFAKRCGTLFLINLVPLYLGGRSSIIVDRILRVPCSQYLLLHKWLGRICVIQGIVHGISSATATTFTVVEILLLSLLGAVGCLSFLYVRRYMYEVFLKVHLISALALLGTLYFHKHLLRNRSAIGLGIASGLWLVQQVIRIIRILYRNSGSRTAGSLLLHRFPSLNAPVQCLDATITLKNAWKVEPGQYVYLSLPSISRHRAGFLQSHPYTVAWSDDATVTLLIQRAAGFSNTIFETSKQQSSVIVDGPYGKEPPIQDFDKVLYIASGIGIAAHLLSIRQLLQDHENQSARVRRLTLLWFLETREQEEWANHFLCQIREQDRRRIFTLALYTPPVGSEPTSTEAMTERWIQTDQPLDLSWFIDTESSADAGNMAISVCGPPHFEDAVRNGVRKCKKDVHLFSCEFQPEETSVSRASQVRYS